MDSSTQPFKDKVLAISGAASGIGFAVAKHALSLGARLSLADNRQEPLDAAVQRLQSPDSTAPPSFSADRILATVIDVRSSEQVNRWVDDTVTRFGRLDGAANLAGVVGPGVGTMGVADVTDEEWSFVLDVNLTGVFYATRAQIRAMRANPDISGGSIVNAASTSGLHAAAFNSPYGASKHGVIGLTKSAAKEVGGEKIRVNAIAPGVIDTAMVRTLPKPMVETLQGVVEGQPLGRMGTPEEIAKVVMFLLGNESSFVTGTVITIDGGELA